MTPSERATACYNETCYATTPDEECCILERHFREAVEDERQRLIDVLQHEAIRHESESVDARLEMKIIAAAASNELATLIRSLIAKLESQP